MVAPSRRILATGLLVSLGPAVVFAQQQQGAGLHSLAKQAGKLFFGTATDTNNLDDAAYMQVVNNANEFGLLVPENSMKWQPTEPTQDNFTFTNPDRVRALALQNGQTLRCHTLTWFQQLPQFIATTEWTRETLTSAIQTHISNVVGHYSGSCYSWDVVNEALNDGNGSFRNSVFFTTLGTDFIPISFQAAAAADPGAKLYYNDFSLEFNSSKTDGALDIVRLVQNASARIDGVGFQGHFTVGGTPAPDALAGVLNRFVDLGVEVAFTELDVRHTTLPANDSALQQQATDYMSVVGACLAVQKCVGVVVWQFSDKYSWVPSTFKGAGEACLYDENFNRKPAWTSVSAQLAAAATAAAGLQGNGAAGVVATPAANTPVANTPAVDNPAANAPVVDTPAANTPAANTPAANTPAANTPAANTPAANTPAANTPAANTPAASTPAASTPAASTPAASTPAADTPAANTTAAQSSAAQAAAQEAATTSHGGSIDQIHVTPFVSGSDSFPPGVILSVCTALTAVMMGATMFA